MRLMLAAGATLLALAGAELSARILLGNEALRHRDALRARRETARALLHEATPQSATGAIRLHPYYGYTMMPGYRGNLELDHFTRCHIDRYGFRNATRDYARAPDDTLVVGLFGGSAVFGDGLHSEAATLAGQLEAALTQRLRRPVWVLNFGIPGWQHPQQFFAIARTVEHLDLIVTCDGFNEIILPYINRYEEEGRSFPMDFPNRHLYLPLFANAAMPYAAIRQLESDAAYDPDSIAAHFVLVNWMRHRMVRRRWAQIAEEQRERAEIAEGNTPDAPAIPRERFERTASYGVAQWVRYAHMIDAVAAQHEIAALHIVQPFRYAAADATVNRRVVGPRPWAQVFFLEPHPSHWYSLLRRAAADAYADAPSSGALLDYSEQVPYASENWLDFVHLSAESTQNVAQGLADHIVEHRMLDSMAPRPETSSNRKPASQ